MARSLDLPDIPAVSRLADTLWGDAPLSRRSRELTCLYVQRYSGQRLQTHLTHHPFTELLYVFGGQGTLRGSTPIPLHQGVMILIPPGYAHMENAPQLVDTLWIGLRGTRIESLNELRCVDSVELQPLMDAIWLLGQWRYGTCGPELEGLCVQALARFARLSSEGHSPIETELVHRATTYLRRHHTRPITVALLAAELGVSEGYLHRRFRAGTGKTPIDYLTDLRLASAMDMLRHSNMSVRRIAQLNGFTDPLYFSRLCRQRTGHPPTYWRGETPSPSGRGSG